MSDVAAFERIAAAVLRASNPALYGNLAHPGVQPGGKTVKSPFDNVGWRHSDKESRLVCAAHTTEQKDLEGKWLHDPSTVKPRKAGGKPTKPAGDLVKGIAEVRKLREVRPGLSVTFALTTNRETSLELLVSVQALAESAGIDLDVWSVSRLAHFLDTDPVGQIIRRAHLGTPVKLLSRELLLEMGRRSIRDHIPLAISGEIVRRDGFELEHADTLVVGASGMGKTTACATALDAHIARGLPAVVLKTEFVGAAATLEVALEHELRRQEPELEVGAGGTALGFCSDEQPLLVLIEDVNRADNPGAVLNKILGWTRTAPGGGRQRRVWRAVCPLWPRHLEAIEDQKRVLSAVKLLQVDKYSPAEARKAVRARAEALGRPVDEHRAASIATRLGHDPLLIGLHDLTSEGTAASVIRDYVDERLGHVATQADRLKSEVVDALRGLMRGMLQHRKLNPQWSDARSWLNNDDAVRLVRAIALDGSLIRVSRTTQPEVLEFRHDRVMHHALGDAIAEVLRSDAPPEYAADPFFAEMVAAAVVQVEFPTEGLCQLMDQSPAVIAYALKIASELGSPYADTAANVLQQWLQQVAVRGEAKANRRYAVASVLAETTSPHVRPIVAQFPAGDYPWYPLLAAGFRNGDVGAGLALLSVYEIGVTVGGKPGLLAFVKRAYGRNLVAAVDSLLRRAHPNDQGRAGMRVGGLNLAGYLGDSSLAEAIRTCWDQDDDRGSRLRSYLFAAVRCCGKDAAQTLGPVCDAWESLPEEEDSTLGQPAERLAADHVAWEFRTYNPRDAVPYFIARANASEKIGWPITYMLRTVDHPDVAEHLARWSAKAGFFAAHALKSDWERLSREEGKRMSTASKESLLRLAQGSGESEEVRKRAFALWELTLGDSDVEIARNIPTGSPLYERALWARARRHDRSVIPELISKLPQNPEYWLQIARYLWSDELTKALEPLLDQVADEEGEGYTNLEYAVALALRRVEPSKAAAMLGRRWTRLKAKPLMVQHALLSTSDEMAAMVREAVASSDDSAVLFKHFVSNATIESEGGVGLSSPAQLEYVRPYLDLMPKDEIDMLWSTCTRKGWLEFRHKWLDPKIQNDPDRHVFLPGEPVDITDLDRALAGDTVHRHEWVRREVDRGASREQVVKTMLDWLRQHGEPRAMAIVGDIFGREATRQEFDLLVSAIADRADVASVVDAVRFDVFSRSLS